MRRLPCRSLLLWSITSSLLLGSTGVAAAACPARPLPPCKFAPFTGSVKTKAGACAPEQAPSCGPQTQTSKPRGATGKRGLKGRTGSRGAVGASGRDGGIGAGGPAGAAGPQGLQGTQGVAGAQGAVGSEGAAGAQGTAGTDGTIGPQGIQGLQGVQGITGAAGTPGTVGAPGVAGAAGPTGPAGPQGLTGVAGTAGAAGPQGPGGAAGVGTTGPTGDTGAAGTAGADGLTGPQGVAGAAGGDGATGPAGPTGAIGPAGAAGTIGLAEYAYIFNDEPETVEVEDPVLFSDNGVMSTGIAHTPGTAEVSFVNAGVYKVAFSVTGLQANQMGLFLDDTEVAGGIYGSGSPTQQNNGEAILTIPAGGVVTLLNHSSAAAVALQTLAGGTQANVNASLTVEKLN